MRVEVNGWGSQTPSDANAIAERCNNGCDQKDAGKRRLLKSPRRPGLACEQQHAKAAAIVWMLFDHPFPMSALARIPFAGISS